MLTYMVAHARFINLIVFIQSSFSLVEVMLITCLPGCVTSGKCFIVFDYCNELLTH